MQLLENITPKVYDFLKRNPILLKQVKLLLESKERVRTGFISHLHLGNMASPPDSICENTGDWVEQYCEEEGATSASIRYLHHEEKYQRKNPGHLEDELFWKFSQNLDFVLPPTFVAEIPNARVLDGGFVITPDNRLLSDVSVIITPKSPEHSAFRDGAIGPVKKFAGKVAVLATYAGQGYYHWMIDVLPRIELLKQANYDLNDIDKFIINSYLTSYQMETLAALGIPRDKLILTQRTKHLCAELLILPSLSNVYECVPKWSCDFINRKILGGAYSDGDTKGSKLYISRASASHRRVKNESQLVDLLKKRGFEIVALEKMSVVEQAQLFRRASTVIAPHGAGLTNLVFCDPATKVVEIIHPGAINLLFWTIASQRDLDYNYIFANGDLPSEGAETFLNGEDMELNLDKIESMLDKIDAH